MNKRLLLLLLGRSQEPVPKTRLPQFSAQNSTTTLSDKTGRCLESRTLSLVASSSMMGRTAREIASTSFSEQFLVPVKKKVRLIRRGQSLRMVTVCGSVLGQSFRCFAFSFWSFPARCSKRIISAGSPSSHLVRSSSPFNEKRTYKSGVCFVAASDTSSNSIIR